MRTARLFPEWNQETWDRLFGYRNAFDEPVVAVIVSILGVASGAFLAFPPAARLPRSRKILLRIGEPLVFDSVPNRRAGWEAIGAHAQDAVRRLGNGSLEERRRGQ
jgi:hypothetical protein